MPTMASALSLGCQRAVSCVNEARVTVSMVTSPACHPSSSPSSTAFGMFSVRSRPCGGRERRRKWGRSLSKEQPGKSQSVHYLCRCFDSLRWSGNGNKRELVTMGQAAGVCFSSPLLPPIAEVQRDKAPVAWYLLFWVPRGWCYSMQRVYSGVILLVEN